MTSQTPEASLTASILIVNTLGDLRHLYRNADVAYVGAGFEKGPHNVIEPLIYGVPTICGPNINKFPMAQHLDKKKLLKVISTPAALQEAIQLALKVDRDVFNISAAKELNQLEANIDNLIKELSPN